VRNLFSAFLTILIGILAVIAHELHILNTATDNFGGIFFACANGLRYFINSGIIVFAEGNVIGIGIGVLAGVLMGVGVTLGIDKKRSKKGARV
jgi:hypothetical protein